MPYIPKSRREGIEQELFMERLNWLPANAGDLNFVISTFISNYIREKGLNYAVLNEMIGALECAKMELNRVVIGPYEDNKIQDNGAVYDEVLSTREY